MGTTVVSIGVAPLSSWGIRPGTPISVLHRRLRYVEVVICHYPMPLVTTHWPALAPAFWPAGKNGGKSMGAGCPKSRRPGGTGRLIPQQWLAHTTAPRVHPADRRRLDLVIYGATPLSGALCCDAALVADGPATAVRGHTTAVRGHKRRRNASSRRAPQARQLPRAQRWGPAAPGGSRRLVGGRWNDGAQRLLRDLVRVRAGQQQARSLDQLLLPADAGGPSRHPLCQLREANEDCFQACPRAVTHFRSDPPNADNVLPKYTKDDLFGILHLWFRNGSLASNRCQVSFGRLG